MLALTLIVVVCGSACGGEPADGESLADAEVETTAVSSTTTTTTPAIDLADVAKSFNSSCESASTDADPGDTYLLGDLATADEASLTIDLNKRSSRLCADMLFSMMRDTFGFSESTISRMEGTRALDGELSATSSDGSWSAFWRYHPDNGLDVALEGAPIG